MLPGALHILLCMPALAQQPAAEGPESGMHNLVPAALAQNKGDPPPPSPRRRFDAFRPPPMFDRPPPDRLDSEEGEEWLQRLPPELRSRFEEGFRKWRRLPEKQRSQVRERFAELRVRMTEAAEGAYKAAGLQLDEAGRQRFLRRYFEKRRELEDRLRKELEERRKEELPKLEAELKAEFEGRTPSAGADETNEP